jgi:N-acetylmuramoyl-L-alanine amidase
VRIPVGVRVPFHVSESDRVVSLEFYGAVADIDWTRYAPSDTLIRRIDWHQNGDVVRIDVELRRALFGYRTRWDGADLLLDIRRPPAIDRRAPLRGRRIAVDPGHPPAGATGPTGLREAVANLAIALELQRLLQAAGATVIMTRTADVPLDLGPRITLAESGEADALVSIHNNALPDGVNPFTNNGTSVFYNHAASLPLARAVQRALVRNLGLRDLGVGRGDLALVRPTWQPSILTEGLYMIVPEQEAALRSAEGQRRYAQGVLDGLRSWFLEYARQEM